MGVHTATSWNRWVKSAEEGTLYAGRFNIGPRLILGFVFIILSMLAADAVVLWQFHLVRTQAERLNGIDQKLIAVLRVHTSLLAFHDRLEELADSQDVGRLVTEGGPLRTAVLEDTRRAISALSFPPFEPRRDPTILPTLHVLQSALPSQLEAITTLATSGDWRAVHLRLANEVTPLETLTSAIVENVDHEVGEEQAQAVVNIRRVQRLVFLVVPLTVVFTLLIAATLGVAITRSITRPLARLVEGSHALARGEFQHQVSVTGEDELAHLGQVFNDTARRLRDLYATLQSSEDRLRLVIDTIPAHAWSAQPDGSVDFINQRFLEFTGRSKEDMLGWGWGSLLHPDDFTRYVGAWQAAVATGEPMESEARVRRMDGDYCWLLIRNVPLRDQRGNIVNWYGTAIDIEERHRAEDALRRSETYLSEAQRLSHTGSFGWCVSTGEINWSEETIRIFQYERSTKPTIELILQRVHSEDASSFKETVARASQDGKDFEHEYRLVMPDGAVKHVHVVARAEREESGEIEFVGAVMDITDRKRAEEALRQSEAYLAEAQRLSHTGSWAWNLGTIEQFWSVETFQIYGFDPNATTPTRESFLERVHPDDRASIELAETELYKGNDTEYSYRIILPDGSIKYITSVAHSVRNDSGQVIEFVGTVMDVTERKRAEEERERLRQAQADLARVSRVTTMGELTASLAHEIKQPIAAAFTNAKTCLRWLGRDQPDVAEAREAAARIVTDVTRASDIISRVRLLFQKGPPEREPLDVNGIIEEMIALLRNQANRYSISISSDLAGDLPKVSADHVLLQQVLMNLMLNGIEAMMDRQPPGRLTVKSRQAENGQILISISDTGAGLSPEQAEQIFNAFFTTKPHGTGMGLSISRSIIESHGGRLWAADNSPRGATFCFTLPTKVEASE